MCAGIRHMHNAHQTCMCTTSCIAAYAHMCKSLPPGPASQPQNVCANVGGKCVGCPCPASELEAEHDAGPDEEGPAVGAACGNQNEWDVARAGGDEHSYMFTSRGDMDVEVLSSQEVGDEATAWKDAASRDR